MLKNLTVSLAKSDVGDCTFLFFFFSLLFFYATLLYGEEVLISCLFVGVLDGSS
jgi:hypothetical protein